jgi:hypothetical protein
MRKRNTCPNSNTVPKRVLFYILNRLGSNLSPTTVYPDWFFSWFYSVPLGKYDINISNEDKTTSFHIIFNSVLTNPSTIRHRMACVSVTVLTWTLCINNRRQIANIYVTLAQSSYYPEISGDWGVYCNNISSVFLYCRCTVRHRRKNITST